jgi:hypothetical protein
MNKSVSDCFKLPGVVLPDVIDLRNLEAPEPMEHILLACSQLGADEYYLARLPHAPAPLYPQLELRGMDWQVYEEAEDSTLILIRRKS